MAGEAPLVERVAGVTPVAAAEVLELIERLSEPQSDPVIGPLFGMDDEGEAVVNPLGPAALQRFPDQPELPCYVAAIEGLTRVWERPVGAAAGHAPRAA